MNQDIQDLKALLRRSRQLARETDELAGRTRQLMSQTQQLLMEFYDKRKNEGNGNRKKSGPSQARPYFPAKVKEFAGRD